MTHSGRAVRVLYITTQFKEEAKMTHLEILAGKLDEMGEHAVLMAQRSRNLKRPLRSEYYHGQVVAFGQAADMLRQEALERERIDKEETE